MPIALRRCLLASCVPWAALSAQTNWVQRNPAASPPARLVPGMAYDAARNRVVLFGGSDGTGTVFFGDTWEWDGSNWTQRSPVSSPSPRGNCKMVFDSARQRTVLFGGYDGGEQTQTWEWDGTDWSLRSPIMSPLTGLLGAMAYDSARGRVVLFSGFPFAIATWEWDGTSWTQQFPTVNPPGRVSSAIAYDAARARTVLFGGVDFSGVFADTWEWDGVNWARRVTAGSPPARQVSTMDYDRGRDRMVLFGGTDLNGSTFGDTWELSGNTWTAQTAATSPSPRLAHRMAYDSARGRIVLFGGQPSNATPAFGDTWEYSTVNPASNIPFGSGCPGASGIPSLTNVAFPWLGGNLRVDVGNLAAGSLPFLLLGLSDTIWNGGPLPFPLAQITAAAAPGCDLLVSPDSATLLTRTGNTANYSLAIPVLPVLLGTVVFQQAAQLDASAGLSLSVSNGLQATVGRL